ncbi:MAG: hypothetical protein ACR2L1_09135 [Pyrinomonadaceae bacterium]
MKAKTWEQKQKDRQNYLRNTAKGDSARNLSKSFYSILAVIAAALVLAAGFGVFAYQNFTAETPLEVSGNTIFVKAGGNFQAALEQAKPGDTILLQAGATFRGNFNLPTKSGADFIIVRTSAAESQIPAADARLDPAKYAGVLPKLVSPNSEPVLSAYNGAHHFRFVGIEFGATKNGVGNIVKLGTTEEKRVEDLPHHIEFDRVYVHGDPVAGQRRGIAANGKYIRIVNSYFSDLKKEGDEAQAIAVWATDGPVEIINNYLEGSAENILFGGGASVLKLVPTDCVVRGNHLNKPLEWRSTNLDVKNFFEIKNGRRIKVDNNLMTNNWAKAQDGTGVLFSTRADNGAATIIEDIEFTNNIVRGTGNGISVYGAEGSGGHRLTIRNNFFEDINGQKWGGAGFFMKSSAWDGLVIENNTIINSGDIAHAYDAPTRGFVFRGNIIFQNEYGIKGDGTPSGQATIDKFFPNGEVSGNVIIGGDAAQYRGKNLYLKSIEQVGFVNAQKGNYQLRPDSPLRDKNIGAKN